MSAIMPDFSQDLLNLRKALSKVSLFRTITLVISSQTPFPLYIYARVNAYIHSYEYFSTPSLLLYQTFPPLSRRFTFVIQFFLKIFHTPPLRFNVLLINDLCVCVHAQLSSLSQIVPLRDNDFPLVYP